MKYNYETNTDLRIIKSKDSILNALNELIKQKPIDRISVSELARIAKINKGTFYLHFDDIFDLYQFALQQHLNKMVEQMDFMHIFLRDSKKFSQLLVSSSITTVRFQNDPFFSMENRKYNQTAQILYVQALISKIFTETSLEKTTENEFKLAFIFSGIGTLFRYNHLSNSDLIEKILLDSINNLFNKSKNKQ